MHCPRGLAIGGSSAPVLGSAPVLIEAALAADGRRRRNIISGWPELQERLLCGRA
jgi:hypothetical protein